jgi:hypothetical protein
MNGISKATSGRGDLFVAEKVQSQTTMNRRGSASELSGGTVGTIKPCAGWLLGNEGWIGLKGGAKVKNLAKCRSKNVDCEIFATRHAKCKRRRAIMRQPVVTHPSVYVAPPPVYSSGSDSSFGSSSSDGELGCGSGAPAQLSPVDPSDSVGEVADDRQWRKTVNFYQLDPRSLRSHEAILNLKM